MPIDLGSINNRVGHITREDDTYIVHINPSITSIKHSGGEGELMGELFKDYGNGKPGLVEYIDQERAAKKSHAGKADPVSVVIDMPQMTYLSDTAIGKLISLQIALKQRGITDISIVNDDKSIKDSFHIKRLDKIFRFEPTLDDALVQKPIIVQASGPNP